MDLSCSSPGYGHCAFSQPLFKLAKDFEPFEPFSFRDSPVKRSPQTNIQRGSSSSDSASAAECTMEYLSDLLKEKKQLSIFPQIFRHIERLVEEEISRVRMVLFQCNFSTEKLELPEPEGEPIVAHDKVYVPIKEHPEYNFVGRILGPRGMTAKQLEQDTGCKIMVRGRGSMRDRRKEELHRGKPNWEHLDDDLHVLLQCEDTPNRVYSKIKAAAAQIKKLLVPAPDGADELKRKQLMELAIINGTYRPINSKYQMQSSQVVTPMSLVSPIRHAGGSLSAPPMFVSPTGSPVNSGTSITTSPTVGSFMQSPNIDYNMLMNQLSFDAALASFSMLGDYKPYSSPTYPLPVSLPSSTTSRTPGLKSYFPDTSPITPPASFGSAEKHL